MRLIGTAGHIDHGKSTLVEALTGVHPSRLPEERARGMTIDLGYAHLDHPRGYRLGIVDVPGHERLVKNMAAGATGFDLALWVVDAREGVRPQSREHLHILELLGVRALIPVLTKVAVADAEQVAAARRDVVALLAGRDLRVLPLHAVDSVAGAGIPALKDAIFAATGADTPGDDEDARPYLPVDRVFSVPGVGTVVTGTLARGTLAEGDQVALGARPGTWRVRALTNHRARVARIAAGHRVGVNLAGLDANAVRRGDVLVAPDHPYRGRVLNARLRWTPEAPRAWKHGARLLFHAGCLEVECRVWDVAGDGDASWAQLELPREAVFFPGQRFLLRGGSPLATVGGGEVLDLAPDRPRHVTAAERAAYACRADGGCLTVYLEAGAGPVLDLALLARRWMVAPRMLRAAAERSPTLRLAQAGVSLLTWTAATERDVRDRLRRVVEDGPATEHVVPYDRLARALRVSAAHVQPLLRSLLARDGTSVGGDAPADAPPLRLERAAAVVHPGRTGLTAEEQRVADAVLARLHAEWLRPGTIAAYRAAEPEAGDVFDRVVARLCAGGRAVRVGAERGDLLLHAEAAAALREAPGRLGLDGVRAAEFCQALGVTRRHGVAYLEYLGRERVLRRDGDRHYRVGARA
ncbi:hypothetical protein tb265_06700 [Gemmatimonadetes bacterium T265]|nr:hypothetical protein tb265_06700 [Gemmatimonadetes bacterium T265]